MKSYFTKTVIPSDIEMRNKLLRKLAYLRNDKSKSLMELKRAIKARIRLTQGSTSYHRYHRGVKFYLGDETTPKKQFLIYRHTEVVNQQLITLRQTRQRINYKFKEHVIEKTAINYKKCGGVMVLPNVFGSKNRQIKRQKVYKFKAPKNTEDYVGIEIEFASKYSIESLADLIADNGLHESVRVMRDSSIEVSDTFPSQIELCILTRFKDLSETLTKLQKFIVPQYFQVNPSCGLHVHLDARMTKDVEHTYRNLVSIQSVLFGLANESRRENRYCHPVPDLPFDQTNMRDHYAAISSSSYIKHRTIEVRIHHATLDLSLVGKWVKLLKRVADYRGVPLQLGTFESELKQLKEQVQIEPELMDYIYQQTGT